MVCFGTLVLPVGAGSVQGNLNVIHNSRHVPGKGVYLRVIYAVDYGCKPRKLGRCADIIRACSVIGTLIKPAHVDGKAVPDGGVDISAAGIHRLLTLALSSAACDGDIQSISAGSVRSVLICVGGDVYFRTQESEGACAAGIGRKVKRKCRVCADGCVSSDLCDLQEAGNGVFNGKAVYLGPAGIGKPRAAVRKRCVKGVVARFCVIGNVQRDRHAVADADLRGRGGQRRRIASVSQSRSSCEGEAHHCRQQQG